MNTSQYRKQYKVEIQDTKYKEVWAIRTSLRVPLCVLTVTSSWICVDTYLVYKCRYIDSKLLLAIQSVVFNAKCNTKCEWKCKTQTSLRGTMCVSYHVCVCVSKKCHQELENALYYIDLDLHQQCKAKN